MQMPSNGFDIMAASARMDTYSTVHHRRRWPSLDWVWDELDDLRASAVDAEDRATIEGERDAALGKLYDMRAERDGLQTELDDLRAERDARTPQNPIGIFL